MLRKNKLIVFEEVDGEFIPKKDSDKFAQSLPATLTALVSPLVLPLRSFAADNTSIVSNEIYDKVMTIFDAGVPLVIVFAGGAWALGHRTKAIHMLIGVCIGYLLARNAIPIRDFLKGV